MSSADVCRQRKVDHVPHRANGSCYADGRTRRTARRCAARSLGRCVMCSGRSIRSARCAGSGGRMPVARSTASGNLAGWAVASVTIGPCDRRAQLARADADGDGRVRIDQHPGRLVGAADHVERLAVVEAGRGERRRRRTRRAGRPRSTASRSRGSAAAARRSCPPSRPLISNSRRSKLDDTWMSIDGLSDGTTGRVLMSLSREEAGEDVVGVRGDDEPVDRCAHLLGDPPGEHVAEVAARHAEVDRLHAGDRWRSRSRRPAPSPGPS